MVKIGLGIEPASKTVIGSLEVPYIYEDRASQSDFEKSLNKALKINSKTYEKMSTLGRKHVSTNYNFEDYEKNWIKIMDDIIEKYGSWDNRVGYQRWHLMEVA